MLVDVGDKLNDVMIYVQVQQSMGLKGIVLGTEKR
jgi:hypothetical protein